MTDTRHSSLLQKSGGERLIGTRNGIQIRERISRQIPPAAEIDRKIIP